MGNCFATKRVRNVKSTFIDESGKTDKMAVQKAVFAAGCFWGVEATFRKIPGVVATKVGYTGGHTANPTYRQVCNGDTGHAEGVEVVFDDQKVKYEDLIQVFWDNHNPTTKNRQGPDHGTQYRSAVFYFNDEQKNIAEKTKINLQKSKYEAKGKTVVTEIVPAAEFYAAEEYHQQYLEKQGRTTCHI